MDLLCSSEALGVGCAVSDFLISVTAVCASLALVSLGGGLYEFSVVDPFWPGRPDLIQPGRGGISRKRFWIAAHTAFESCWLWRSSQHGRHPACDSGYS